MHFLSNWGEGINHQQDEIINCETKQKENHLTKYQL